MSEVSIQELENIANRIDKLLRPTSFPIGVKLFEHEEEVDNIRDKEDRPIRKIQGKNLAVCQVLGQARFLGQVKVASKKNASMCMYGSAVLGFEKLPLEYMHGYVRAYFNDEKVAEKNFANTPMFKEGSHEAILVAPLEKMPVIPDVVIFYGNTAQIYRLIHAYNYNKGVRLEFSSNGEAGGCADIIVSPMLTKKPSVAFPCNGARMLSWPSDDGLACGISISILKELLEGLEFTHDGMIRYPLTWQQLDWEVPEGTILWNAIRAKGFYPPDQRHPERK
jgi:uncharacterized protein (DUF169 family)